MKKYNILTIERQYASAGSRIARQISDKLGIKCYGHELLELAADKIGMNKDYLKQIEESATNSMLYSFLMNPEASMHGADLIPPTDKLFMAESEIINDIASKENCIFIGRAAGSVLAERSDCLRVFIYSDKEKRIKRAVEEYGINEKEAAGVLKRYDKRRSNFYSTNCSLGWEDKEGYDMMLNSAKLGVDGCVDAIIAEFQK